MALYIVPFFVLQAVGYLAIVYSLLVVSNAPERTLAFRLLLICMVSALVGATLRAMAFYFFNESALLSFTRSHTEIGGVFELIGVQLVAFGWILKPLLFRSLHRPISRTDYALVAFIWLILAASPTLLFERFGYGPATGFGTSTVIVIVAGWSLYELKRIEKTHGQAVRAIRFMLTILIISHACFALYNLYFILEIGVIEEAAESYIKTDLFTRVCRISLFFMLDALCLFYWWQYQSTSAIQARSDRKKIELALIEKDLLIKNLINANALIQTGAMTTGLSHEINQFLARIQLDVESAKARLANRGVEDVLIILNRVLNANSGAASLVQNIKKLFVRHDEGFNVCEVDGLIQSVAALYLARARLLRITMTFDLRANVQAGVRETLIRQVVSNLIVNALDALESVSRQDKRLTIETYVEGDRWILRVSDNASGIRPENAHKIFSLFSTTKSKGTGIGLWLSRYIVEEHGGSLRFTNRDSEGVMFWVDMPIEPPLVTPGAQLPVLSLPDEISGMRS